MSSQPARQLSDEVYPQVVPIGVMVVEDFKILYASSLTCRKAWVFGREESRRSEDDALLMLDLSIEGAGS